MSADSFNDCVAAVIAARGGSLGALADGIAELGLGKSQRAQQVRAQQRVERERER